MYKVRNWKNIYVDGAVHHITGTVHQWQPILLYPPITDLMYYELSHKSKSWHIKLIGYVIMSEHFHLLATGEKGKNIEKFTHGFRRSVSGEARKIIIENDEAFQAYCRTKKVNCRSFYFKTAGKSDFRFWKEKPRIFPMDREKDILRIMQYIHNNPSRRGLVENNVDWQHSSCRYYETGEKGRIEVGWK